MVEWEKELSGVSFKRALEPIKRAPALMAVLISFSKDWMDLLAVQRTLKSLLQHHSSKASILQYSAFFIIQLSHPFKTLEKP